MNGTRGQADDPAQAASEAGEFVAKAAGAVDPGRSILGRLTATVSAVKLASRLAPAALRLFRRYPVAAVFGLLAVAGALYLARQGRVSARI